MPILKKDDTCRDCKKHKIWKSSHVKADCTLKIKKQGFDPDSIIPAKCIGKNYHND